MKPLDPAIPGLSKPLPASAEPLAEDRDSATLGFELATTFDSGSGEAGSEVVSYFDGRAYVTNGAEDRVDVFDAATGALLFSIDLTGIEGYDGLTSVDVTADGIAVAIDIANLENPELGTNGVVARFSLDGTPIDVIEVGNLPDMLTYSKDGTMIFVANEGEREDGEDPKGGISIIDVATGTAKTFTFDAFDAQVDALREAGVRIFPDSLPSTDFEPEYIAEGPDGKLYVTLQEANAVAVFDLATESWEKIIPLGTADHSVEGFGIDPSDEDGAIDIRTVPVEGIRMPDAIAVEEIDGQVYFFTANEGDSRDFDESRGEDLVDGDLSNGEFDTEEFPEIAALLADDAELGRLTFSNIDGDTDGDGLIEELRSYGSRSFTIYDAEGNVVFDSGDDFETLIAANRVPNAFNNDEFPSEDDPTVLDENRSDAKGPEPEAIAVGRIGDKVFAFVGLERDGGIMIYDVTDPANATFVDYIDSSVAGDTSPETIQFIPASESTNGLPQIAVSYEISGTTALYTIELGKEITGTNAGDAIAGTVGDDVIDGGNGADVIEAKGGDDEIRGGNGADMILGGAGNDRIDGGNGDDRLSGGMGDDEIHGGRGDDLIHGGTGNDLLDGGLGADRFVFEQGDGRDRIVALDEADLIDLSATGLGFGDLEITGIGDGTFEVAYGEGDVITVTLADAGATLGEDAFAF